MTESQIKEIKRLLAECAKEHRKEIFLCLREEFPIHELEKKLNADAEIILETISRSSDLTQRGIRGIIAEAAFSTNVIKNLKGWKDITAPGDHPYDFLLSDGSEIRIQVKMQRLKAHQPMKANQGYRYLPSEAYVVETQRTRGGKDSVTGADTRPYNFKDFDILVVSLHPSTNDWKDFRYTVASWLLRRPDNEELLLKFQPVALEPNDEWTDDFLTAVSWFRSSKQKRVYEHFKISSTQGKPPLLLPKTKNKKRS
jgi:hypothetical protein